MKRLEELGGLVEIQPSKATGWRQEMVRPMFELIDLHDLIIQNTKVMWAGYNAIRRLDHQSSETPEDCYIAAAVINFLWMGSCIQDAKATKRKGNTSWSLRLWKWKRRAIGSELCQHKQGSWPFKRQWSAGPLHGLTRFSFLIKVMYLAQSPEPSTVVWIRGELPTPQPPRTRTQSYSTTLLSARQ